MSGYGRALTVHNEVGLALLVGAFVQTALSVVMWLRLVAAWVARVSIGLFLIVFLQNGLGHTRQYWLHVPIGVGLFGALIRQRHRLES
jgi:hypothetical protein